MSLFATDRERTILRLFKNNTPQAMSILYDEYAGWLTAVCSRYVVNEEDRKDVLQESFIKIFTASITAIVLIITITVTVIPSIAVISLK